MPRPNSFTQWAAQFAVASELCKKNYEVAFTTGNNHPDIDLMVISPKARKPFGVDVKGLYKPNFWVITPKAPRDDLYYVLALVPSNGPNRFFVLSQAEANQEIANHKVYLRDRRLKKGLSTDKVDLFPGLLWGYVTAPNEFEDAWGKLPQ